MSHFNEYVMRARIDECLKTVSVVLDANKSGSVGAPNDISHKYEDKYLLSNHLTNTSIVCVLNGLELMGVSRSGLGSLKTWNSRRAVSLKFERKQTCKFIKEIERDEEDPTRVQVEGVFRATVKVITKIKEYIYLIEEEYSLSAHSGVGDNPAEVIHITSGSSQIEATLRTKSAPFAESTLDSFDVNISWLLTHLDEAAATANFSIDRSAKDCATPRQNPDVVAALAFYSSFSSFCGRVHSQLHHLHDVQCRYQAATAPKFDLAAAGPQDIFNPIVPLFQDHEHSSVTTPTPAAVGFGEEELAVVPGAPVVATLPGQVVNQLVAEQHRSLAAKCAQVASLFVSSASTTGGAAERRSGVFNAAEATLMVVLIHLTQFSHFYREGVDFIEHMIRSQLVAAVGKELTARDFAQYMTFHNRKVFKEAFQPKPFSYAVRRSPLHSPEGQIQIETSETTPAEPIYTVSQHTDSAPLMEFALNATTTVKFGGERHLHGWMAHRFSGQALPELKLVAEARQFSSYIVLIGRIASVKLFQPKYGFIVQNKDEFRIPLELEQIPTAKEFKDAISSLSPEQQRFAKAYRSMQLESTLFGVCVIQIKPQLEKVLKLQADSLTKEIKLTQDLMQLFIKYQIPTDLLSVQGSADIGAEGLVAVKGHAQALQEVLLSAKEEEVAEAELKRGLKRGRNSDEDESDEGSEVEEEDSEEECEEEEDDVEEEMISVRFSRGGKAPKKQFATKTARKSAPSNGKRFKSASPAGTVLPLSTSTPTTSTVPEPIKQQADHAGALDFTAYPTKLEEMYTQYDPTSSLRPTIINAGATWTKRSQAGLLSAAKTTTVKADLQVTEKNAAFDLLDALTRSGALSIEHASLHVIIAATHCFDQSLMDTVVRQNVNPIERVERSMLIMAATLNDVPAAALINEGQLERVTTFSPMLFPAAETDMLTEE